MLRSQTRHAYQEGVDLPIKYDQVMLLESVRCCEVIVATETLSLLRSPVSCRLSSGPELAFWCPGVRPLVLVPPRSSQWAGASASLLFFALGLIWIFCAQLGLELDFCPPSPAIETVHWSWSLPGHPTGRAVCERRCHVRGSLQALVVAAHTNGLHP